MKLETIAVDALRPYERNAKIHTAEQVAQIIESIKDFGFNDPVAIDENNMVIEGHGRLLAVKQLGWKEVPVIRLTGMTEEQKKAYILVHNQLTMNTGFDLDLLETELKAIQGIDMASFGFDLDFDIDMSLEDFDDDSSNYGSQEAKEPRVKRGEIWQCGQHRIMCGDSTDGADVKKLTRGAEMDLCVTDPPYNVAYVGKTEDALTIENDSMDETQFYNFIFDFYTEMLRALKPGGVFYIFHADSAGHIFRDALISAGGLIKQNLIWVKNSMVLGRQDYQWKHEPCLYGWKEGAGHYFVNDRCQTTVFENKPDLDSMNAEQLRQLATVLLEAVNTANCSVIHEDRPSRSALHPTMKPVPLVQRFIQNSSRRGDKVLDLFGGSGTTMMACEACGRTAYLMELDPKYCEAAIDRWEQETGQKAVKIND